MSLSVAIRHSFPGFALEVGFEAPPGVSVLFGRSGSGKTTVANAVAGLLRPDSGRIALGDRVLVDRASGRFVPPHRRRIGYVFQDARLFPHLSVRANLCFGRWFAGRRVGPAAEIDRVVEILGLDGLLERRPGGLSGGERSRVALGRALLSAPELLVMDEPLAALDAARKAEILPYLERLRDVTAVPILYVSHALDEVARLATTVVALEAGRVVRAGPAEEVLADPAAVTALGVREAGSVLSADLRAHHPDGLSELTLSAGRLLLPRVAAEPGARIRVRVLASDVILATGRPEGLSALNILDAEIAAIRPGLGPGVMVQLAIGDDRLLARVTRRSAEAMGLAPGQRCVAVIKSVAIAPADVGGG